jgi:hypothetical protein
MLSGKGLASLVSPPPMVQTVTTLSSPTDYAYVGRPVTFEAKVTPSDPTSTAPGDTESRPESRAIRGKVDFFDGATRLNRKPVSTNASGVARFTISTLSKGEHNITATFRGTRAAARSTSDPLSESILAKPSKTVTTVAGPKSAKAGQPLTFTAKVNVPRRDGTPIGAVAFLDGNTRLGTAELDSDGWATLTTRLAYGRHAIRASYLGDLAFAGSTSTTLSADVEAIATWTSLSSSVNPVVRGNMVTYTAFVFGADGFLPDDAMPGEFVPELPTGTVDFFHDGEKINAEGIPLDPETGTAQYSESYVGMELGEHFIEAVYSGDWIYAGSASEALVETVTDTPVATQVWLWSSANPAPVGEPVTFTAYVAADFWGVDPGPVPADRQNAGAGGTTGGWFGSSGITGSVDFYVDGADTPSYTATLDDWGGADFTTSWAEMGSHTITAVYSGDGNFAESVSEPLTEEIGRAAAWTMLTSSVNPVLIGNEVAYTATVWGDAADVPGGTVTFYDNGEPVSTAALDNGSASWSTRYDEAGPHAIQAVYSGDSTYAAGTSETFTETVTDTKTPTQVGLWGWPNPAEIGAPVTLTAYVWAGDPNGGTDPSGEMAPAPIICPASGFTGSVDFLEGETILGTGSVDAYGMASLTTSALDLGSHTITALYSGDGNFAASASAEFVIEVVVPTPGTVVGSGTLADGQDTYKIDVQAGQSEPFYSGGFYFADAAADVQFTAGAITSVSFGWGSPLPLRTPDNSGGPNAGLMPLPLGSSATITGTGSLNDDAETKFNFVVYVNDWIAPWMDARPIRGGLGSIWVEIADAASGELVYRGGGLLDPGSTLTIKKETPPDPDPIPRPRPLPDNSDPATARQALFAALGRDDFDSAVYD